MLKIGILLILTAFVIYGYSSLKFKSINWFPVHLPVNASTGKASAQFKADVSAEYNVEIEHDRDKDNNIDVKCPKYICTVKCNGQNVGEPDNGNSWSDTIFFGIQKFKAHKGTVYSVDLKLIGVKPEYYNLHPHLRVMVSIILYKAALVNYAIRVIEAEVLGALGVLISATTLIWRYVKSRKAKTAAETN